MRICLIADATSIHTQRWAQYFARSGDEVHLITYEPSTFDYSGVILHVIRSPFTNLYLSFVPRHLKIYFLVKKLKPDIVHAHFISKFGFHAAFLGFSPVVMSAWGDDILIIPHWSKLLWHFTKISMKRANLIYAASEDIRTRICSDFNISPLKVKVNTHGVDVHLFSPVEVQRSADKCIILSNRNFYPVYNLETLIESISIAVSKTNDLYFIIIGQGPEEKKIRALIKEKGVNNYVHIVGAVDSNKMPEMLNSADIYISTSISDGTPVSMLEAMSCALPCIMTDVGGIHEWIKHGETGILVPPKCPSNIAESILSLASDRKKREYIGRNARELVLKYGNKSEIMRDVARDYEALIMDFKSNNK